MSYQLLQMLINRLFSIFFFFLQFRYSRAMPNPVLMAQPVEMTKLIYLCTTAIVWTDTLERTAKVIKRTANNDLNLSFK